MINYKTCFTVAYLSARDAYDGFGFSVFFSEKANPTKNNYYITRTSLPLDLTLRKRLYSVI